MRFSKALIGDKTEEKNIAFSTSNFHVFRSGILAKGEGWKIEGMGSPTKWYFWPNAFVREFAAMMADSWIQQLVMIGLIIMVCWVLTLLL